MAPYLTLLGTPDVGAGTTIVVPAPDWLSDFSQLANQLLRSDRLPIPDVPEDGRRQRRRIDAADLRVVVCGDRRELEDRHAVEVVPEKLLSLNLDLDLALR